MPDRLVIFKRADIIAQQHHQPMSQLSFFSPCIDAGSAEYLAENALDLAGTQRIQGSAPDMGAYETAGPTDDIAPQITSLAADPVPVSTSDVESHIAINLSATDTLTGQSTIDYVGLSLTLSQSDQVQLLDYRFGGDPLNTSATCAAPQAPGVYTRCGWIQVADLGYR
jgi:hypothetical protein